MIEDTARTGSSEQGPQDSRRLQAVLDAAQQFLACRDRVQAQAPWAEAHPVRTLADAIERDFAGFDLERAEARFRAALAALCTPPATGCEDAASERSDALAP
jgi:hypothetical protein